MAINSTRYDILNEYNTISNALFWKNFTSEVLRSNSFEINESNISSLNQIFSSIPIESEKLSTISYFLSISHFQESIVNSFGEVISIIINKIYIELQSKLSIPPSAAQNIISYFKSISTICNRKSEIKPIILSSTISTFSEFLLNADLSTDQLDFSSIFFLAVNLISKCPQNQILIQKFITPDHFTKLFSYVKLSTDSYTQMLIVEWMWRVFKSTQNSIELLNSLNECKTSFLNIDHNQFRKSLHLFLETVNIENQFIDHISFVNLIYNGINLNTSGFLDVNQNSMVIWLIDKVMKLPDVVIFKFNQISNFKIETDSIYFLSKDKLSSFEHISNQKPMMFQFQCEPISKQHIFMNKLTKKRLIMIKSQSNQLNQFENHLIKNPTIQSSLNEVDKLFPLNQIKTNDNDFQSNQVNSKRIFANEIRKFSKNDINGLLNDIQKETSNLLNQIETTI